MSKFIRKERKREKDYNNVKKKGRVVVVNLSALVIIFPPRRRKLIKEALHKNYEVIHSIKALHLDCYVYLH